MTASERGGRRPKVTPQTVEKIKELEREGHSLPAIARHLNECGVPTPTETDVPPELRRATWSKWNVRNILETRHYRRSMLGNSTGPG
ncbi:recombinase family protein [Paractinoplanes rishiriensis]|uniref:Recombinase domain-containing protein n=1 Tax=Paractinoplanes rishiriensis TaxID=1050105 RepID=A0A919JY03_9ACTN|nr:recombinase family protein [Actinoplanes rishiriensis]GIE96823.1 hypothetical protein Ari01nite_42880 [Actinoplanes rishiriensis]